MSTLADADLLPNLLPPNAPDLPTGLAQAGYHTVCVGGVGFFNKLTPLGSAQPDLFAESYWEPEFGVTNPESLERRPCLVIVCSGHGTAYGEGGHVGHRIGHEVVWTVPYTEFPLERHAAV